MGGVASEFVIGRCLSAGRGGWLGAKSSPPTVVVTKTDGMNG
jgi:hypothetical protein